VNDESVEHRVEIAVPPEAGASAGFASVWQAQDCLGLDSATSGKGMERPEPHGPASYDAVILAGGGARRLDGADKPGVLVGGRPLIVAVAAAVSSAGRLVVVGPARPELPDAIAVREEPPGSGPVPALRTGLSEVTAVWTALLAADLPFLDSAHVAELLSAGYGRDGAVLVDDDGREQWLAGVWRTARLRDALAVYTGGSLRGVLAPLEPARVRLPAGERPPWYDCDTAQDVEWAEAAWMEARMLEDWIETVCRELGLDRDDVDRGLILDLARDVAHGVARPAAPLTTYLFGLAVGKGAAPADTAAQITGLAENWSSKTES
jgi:molybdopterin-guanine dinucleotide biosynthesis protein A